MKIVKNIFKIVFILAVIIGSFNVYGYNLKYLGEYKKDVADPTKYTFEITSPVKASYETINSYATSTKGSDGWVDGAGSNRTTYGSQGSFDSAYFIFAASEIFTTYNPGFVSSGTSNNIYYDSYNSSIQSGFCNLNEFIGVKANIPVNQGTRPGSECLKMSVTDSERVIQVKWKVINGVVIEVYALTSKAIDELIAKFGAEAVGTSGIKFSYLLRTIDTRLNNEFQLENKQNMDAAWVYFQTTVGYWNSGGRGFDDHNVWLSYGTSGHEAGSSVANLFDNILIIQIDKIEKVKRDVYINHVDEEGNILPGFENSKLNSVDANDKVIGTINNIANVKDEYKEHYVLTGSQGIAVKKSDKTSIDDVNYTFLRGESASGTTFQLAKTAFQGSKKTWQLPYIFRTNTNKINDVVVVNLVYKKERVKREIYINHVDEDGKVLPGFENAALNLVDEANVVVGTRNNKGPANGFQEYYTIIGAEGIVIKKSNQTKIGDVTYQFLRGELGIGTTFQLAQNALRISKNNISVPYTMRTNTNKVSDFAAINLVYKKIVVPPEDVNQSGLPPLEIIGRLEFINKKDMEYTDSTKGGTLDYIPSTKQLTSYIQDAYPYIVRALRYTKEVKNGSITATITAKVQCDWDEWVYRHGNAVQLICTIPGHIHTAGCYVHKHDATCDWYLQEKTMTMNKVFSYTVPYKHTWFELRNFKMYRISKVEVHDNDSNVGGQLFDEGDYEIDLSQKYENRFNNSAGINKGINGENISITFPSSSYYLDGVNVVKPKPANSYWISSGTVISSESEAKNKASTELNKETHKSASDTQSLKITYMYDNDYVELDGYSDMLQRTFKTWYEPIDKEINSEVRDLDSTKQGSGKENGADVKYTSNLLNYMRPPKFKQTTIDDFVENYKTVPQNRENGLRELKGKIFYEITPDSKYNLGSTEFTSTDATYRLDNLVSVSSGDFKKYDKIYENDDVNKVNVLTPISFGTFELITNEKVDHSTGAGNVTILQKNAEFTITPTTAGSNAGGYKLNDTREFVGGFYFTFDFDIVVDKNNDNNFETEVPALEPIYIAGKNASIKAKTTQSFGNYSADQFTNSVKIVAVTHNVTDALKDFYNNSTFSNFTYMDNKKNKERNTNTQNQSGLLTRGDIINDAYHAIYTRITTRNLGRIFDFAITDCTDVAFKDVFRKTNSGSVNEHIGTAYYAGYKQWDLYNQEYNKMVERTDIGTNPQTILPLGPYKHSDARYVNAPKMGYRISFDLKTTGFMAANNTNNTRRVEVTPTYYYISKDGQIFDNNIKLYFKNSNGNYIDFASSGYTIYYKPNDGYRYLKNSVYTDIYTSMSTKLEPLTITDKITLRSSAMSMSNDSFIQAWYGEFKLPNSTIAVSNVAGNVHNNINNPYRDGYIGVIFKIECIDTGDGAFTLSYNTPDKSSSSSINTSEWDYEGYMKFNPPGSPVGLINYKLENGFWQINNARYQQIKGTVVLFDMDNRAASDFE